MKKWLSLALSSFLFLTNTVYAAAPAANPAQVTTFSQALQFFIIFIVLLACAVLLLYQLVRISKLKSQKKKFLEEVERFSAALYRDKARLSLLLELYSGPSARRLIQPVDAEVSEMLTIIEELQRVTSEIPSAFFSFSSGASIEECKVLFKEYQGVYENLSQKVEKFSELEKENNKAMGELEEKIQFLMNRTRDRAGIYGVAEIEAELAQVNNRIEIVKREQLSDFINVNVGIQPILNQLSDIERLLKVIPELYDRQQQFIREIGEVRSTVDRSMHDNGLTPAELDVHHELDRAQEKAVFLLEQLQAGKIRDAERLSRDIAITIRRAGSSVQDTLELRDSVHKNLKLLDDNIRDLHYPEAEYREELQRVQENFHETVWSSMERDYKEFTKAYEGLRDELPEARDLLEAGRYSKAGEKVMALLESYTELYNKMSRLKVYENAVEEFNQHRAQIGHLWHTFQATVALISTNRLEAAIHSEELGTLRFKIQDQKEMLDRRLNMRPIHLKRLDEEVEVFQKHVNVFREQVMVFDAQKQWVR
ncbi:septation ring formation regulator EzrA [Paenibacillus sp. FJAT-26967]|uniref:septation ring formation regulator EzrA n=1 Tax=Paenibacillus sp. FJAT-26967 TaxID=1729690 RepID=UPI0008388E88|nr:septation ring formation regulator EzrA [Paenibacillus sp. FJAT-26967]